MINNLAKSVLWLLGAAIVVGIAAGLLLWQAKGWHFYVVHDKSMAPVLLPGDAVIDDKVRADSLKVGDIVSYHGSDSSSIVTRRVVHIAKGQVITRGDSLARPDPAVTIENLSGKTIKILPLAGYALDALHRPIVLLSLVYLPALALISIEIKRLVKKYGYKPYHSPRYIPQN